MKTRERILYVSQDLFNRSGASSISTVDIATEMEISPGNLYYHFRNKEEIITELFVRFEEDIGQALTATQMSITHLIDTWLHLKLLFELIWNNRFIYRDTHHIISSNRTLRRKFKRLLQKKSQTILFILEAFIEKEVLVITDQEKGPLVENILVNTCHTINHHALLHDPEQGQHADKEAAIAFAIQQTTMLITPYLADAVKGAFHEAMQGLITEDRSY